MSRILNFLKQDKDPVFDGKFMNKKKDGDVLKISDEDLKKNNPDLPPERRGHLKNYHTHTYRCGHATGDVEDFCKRAVELGFDTLGFSDHCTLPDDWQPGIRMAREELPEYIGDIEKARKEYPSLRLITGMECDFKPEYTNYFKEYLLGEMGLQYLTGSIHFIYDYNGPGMDVGVHGDAMDAKQWKTYTDYYVKAIESNCFMFMNHPDLFGQMICKWDKEAEAASKYIIEAAKGNNMPLELNTSGLVKKQVRIQESHRMQYPVIPFWEMVGDAELDVVVNTDAHNPKRLDTNMLWAENLVEKLGLKRIYF